MSKFDRFQPPPWRDAKTPEQIEEALEEENRRWYERHLEEEFDRKQTPKPINDATSVNTAHYD